MKKNDETPEIRFKEFTQAWEHYNLEEMVTRYKDLVPTPQNGYWKLSVRSHAKGTYLSYVEAGKQITELVLLILLRRKRATGMIKSSLVVMCGTQLEVEKL